MWKRIFSFFLLNVVVVLTVSFVLQLLHIGPYLSAYGLDYRALAGFCLIWGMVGALISLALSRKMAKMLLSITLIDKETHNPSHRQLYCIIKKLAEKAGLPNTPQVGIYSASEANAFATGPTKSRSLIAVSEGLLQSLNAEELEAVIGHEISHIANGDMVTMTLLQGVANAFVMFLARALAFALSSANRNRNSRSSVSYSSYFLLTFLFEITFMLVASMFLAYFSRRREFRADAGSAHLVHKNAMIAARTYVVW